jgi:arylsulfatase A-like enzyme
MRFWCVGMVIMLAYLGQAGFSAASQESASPPRSVVFIVSDALRADVLGCYGGPAITPNIDKLARNGWLFENAFSNATWTAPASVCMFTGRHSNAYPHEKVVIEENERDICQVPRQTANIWKHLAARGYHLSHYLENGLVAHTGALYGVKAIRSGSRVWAKDLDRFDAILGDQAYGWDQSYYSVLSHLLRMPPDRPFFLLVWFLDPHAPYQPPQGVGNTGPGDSDVPRDIGYYRDLRPFEIKEIAPGFSDAEVGLLRDLYLGEVESVDRRIGNIIKVMEHTGRLDDTYIILTSDHGEAFGEHDWFCHGGTGFYDVLTHVPLIIAGPGLPKGTRISARVSHVQIVPTLRSLLGLTSSEPSTPKSLVDPAVTGGGNSQHVYFADMSPSVYAVLQGDWKVMVNGGSIQLFNVADDPRELTDVHREFPQTAERLMELGRRITADNVRHSETVSILNGDEEEREAESEEIKKALRSLGYVQ